MNRYVLGDLMIYAFREKYQEKEHHIQFYIACYLANREIVKLMIELGASLNWGACLGGRRHIAKWMIKLGPDHRNWGLWGACRAGHRHIAEWMIELGADPKSCWNHNHCHPY